MRPRVAVRSPEQVCHAARPYRVRAGTPSGGKWPWFFVLTDDSRMIVANNLSDAMTIFDIDALGELRASDHVTVRRPVFIAPT